MSSDTAAANTPAQRTIPALTRHFTRPSTDPFQEVEWESRTAEVGTKFKQEGVSFPKSWSQNATNIVSEKYFAKGMGERSVREMIERVARRITLEGINAGYFPDPKESDSEGDHPAAIFFAELCHILLNQLAAFNSPVWFNIGVEGRKQQCSACFILSIKDSMDSILHWYTQEGKIFKGGSGSGINISGLRGSSEHLSTGGIASGPVSFMRAADANAGTIKSGGMTRRAAKMVILDADHPDILDFATCKAREEERIFKLLAAGENVMMGDPEGERNLSEVTSFQNANNSIRVTDEFMRLATGHRNGPDWNLVGRKSGEPTERVRAAEVLDAIAEAAWRCGDPGLQYDDTIQRYHTTPAQGRINASNPCAEYLSNDDTSCNLASLNLMKFVREDGSFDTHAYMHTCDVMALAMDILVEFGYYPGDEEGEALGERTRKMRQLGLGYANLGALLMRYGIAYDSQDGRDLAGALASLLTASVYLRSAEIARALGHFEDYPANDLAMGGVLANHFNSAMDAQGKARADGRSSSIWTSAVSRWHKALELGGAYGYRNAQASVMAPTGTISFLMDCITTGVEPSISLHAYKTLAGGGSLEIVNPLVPIALKELGYNDHDAAMLVAVLNDSEEGFIESLHEQHRQVFATSLGYSQVSPEGHIKMLGAIQPHISGGISKTVNVPEETTVEGIRDYYGLAWHEGVKCLAIYRDNSKAMQVMHTKPQEIIAAKDPEGEKIVERVIQRERLPQERDSKTLKFYLGQHSGFLTIGQYDDGRPGEVFVSGLGQEGSTVSGLAGSWAKAISILLQYGVPLEEIESSFAHIRFEPEGITTVRGVPMASSLPDFVVRFLAKRYGEERWEDEGGAPEVERDTLKEIVEKQTVTGKTCPECGGMMQRTGSCYTCSKCGANTGCG